MKSALFLDRDGIINVDKHHVFRIEDIEFVDGIFELVALANTFDMPVIIVTNQAGIARGKYDEQAFHRLMDWMRTVFQSHGARIDAVYFCPTHPDFPDESRDLRYAGWRKPDPGMLMAAAREHNIDLERSFLVGDRMSDAQAGLAAGLRRVLIVNPTLETLPETAGVDFGQSVREACDWLKAQLA